MPAITLFASTFLALWLLASVASLVPGAPLRRVLTPLDRFRFFGSWAMFAPGEGRKGAYGLAYRDTTHADEDSPWILAAEGHYWSWHVFLLDPRRSIADAFHHLGRTLHRHLQEPPTPAVAREIAFIQARLCDYLRHLDPPPAGARRKIRVVKQLGAGDAPAGEVICQFSVATDDQR